MNERILKIATKKGYVSTMKKIAESTKYAIFSEYESVILLIKENGKKVIIGDFYDEVQKAVISQDENYCVMVGYGVIVYFLKEPFTAYNYSSKTKQWKEWYRKRGDNTWIIDVNCLGNSIELIMEDGSKNRLKI